MRRVPLPVWLSAAGRRFAPGSLSAATTTAERLAVRSPNRPGATIIFITHDVEEAVYLSDRVMVIDDLPGRIVHEVATELPRPRDQIATRDEPRYQEVRHELARVLRHDHAA